MGARVGLMTTVISGGQTGADQGGLEGALEARLNTGGMAAKDFKTEAGQEPQLGILYGLMDVGMSYDERTEYNVMNSDGTLLIMWVNSPGSVLTLKTIRALNKTYWTIDYPTHPKDLKAVATDIARWIQFHDIKVLNVAGNRESKAPGIQKYTRELVKKIADCVRKGVE